MSKRELKKYIAELSKEQLEEQIVDLYERFKDVKEFYNFAFNPKEDKLIEEAKIAISKEYFPPRGRRAKMRVSVAQKLIKKFQTLEVDSALIADIMLYNIEIAQTYTDGKVPRKPAFYNSMQKSFYDALRYLQNNGLIKQFANRLDVIAENAYTQKWPNKKTFDEMVDLYTNDQ